MALSPLTSPSISRFYYTQSKTDSLLCILRYTAAKYRHYVTFFRLTYVHAHSNTCMCEDSQPPGSVPFVVFSVHAGAC